MTSDVSQDRVPALTIADVVRQSARTLAPDFYLSALLAPAKSRADLVAVSAFLGEVDRIIATISDPALAEIRLQWWSDAIVGAARGEKTGAPIADALGDTLRRRGLPVAEFEGLIEARTGDLYADPFADTAALQHYLSAADGAAFRLFAKCIDGCDSTASLIAAAGLAYGHARLLRTRALFLARGRDPFAGAFEPTELPSHGDVSTMLLPLLEQGRARLTSACNLWQKSHICVRQACLPLALVGPYLRAVSEGGRVSFAQAADISPLTRVWCLWLARYCSRL